MAGQHDHNIIDKDPNFTIDVNTRTITNNSSKVSLMQYDYNSERFSFEVDRYIEEHDMLGSTNVRIHYRNTSSSNRNPDDGVYKVTDIHLKTNEDGTVDDKKCVFSWLISGDVTEQAGAVTFLIEFFCVDINNIVVYRWSTNVDSSISIIQGMNFADEIVNREPDPLLELQDKIVTEINIAKAALSTDINDKYAEFETEMEQYVANNFETSVAFATTDEVRAIFDFDAQITYTLEPNDYGMGYDITADEAIVEILTVDEDSDGDIDYHQYDIGG